MTLSFSQRHGYREVREVFQTEEIDEALKTGIWNALQATCFNGNYNFYRSNITDDQWLIELSGALWTDYLKKRINKFPFSWDLFEEQLEHYYEAAQWYEIYDLIEFIAKTLDERVCVEFKKEINIELEKEMSGFRLVEDNIIPIIEEVEIQAIEEAVNNRDLSYVSLHLKSALELMSDRNNPSYRNSIKESISAVEGVAKLITNEKSIELKPALNKLESELKVPLHGALKSGFLKIYGYTSDGDGIRHALTEEENVSFEDAKFMLIACSAFVNYLIAKAGIAGIELKE